jgi:hypothetical protein
MEGTLGDERHMTYDQGRRQTVFAAVVAHKEATKPRFLDL